MHPFVPIIPRGAVSLSIRQLISIKFLWQHVKKHIMDFQLSLSTKEITENTQHITYNIIPHKCNYITWIIPLMRWLISAFNRMNESWIRQLQQSGRSSWRHVDMFEHLAQRHDESLLRLIVHPWTSGWCYSLSETMPIF